MTDFIAEPQTQSRQLRSSEIDEVSGGMKWQRGVKNPDVIDARGGQITLWFGRFTLDINGKISSFTPA